HSLHAREVLSRNAFGKSRERLARNDDNFVFYINAAVGIDVLRLNDPAVAGKDERPGQRRRGCVRQEVVAIAESLAVDFGGGLVRIDLFPSQGDLLEEGPIVTGRLESPTPKIHGNELGGRIQATRRRVASFHFIGSDEKKVAAQLRGGDRVNATGLDDRGRNRSGGARVAALGKGRGQSQRPGKQNERVQS